MADILKTWPAFMDPKKVHDIFSQKWARFYFSLGRGKPKQQIEHIWFTHQGVVLGFFDIEQIVKNDGSLPKLRSISNNESTWQFKPDIYVMICIPPMHWLDGIAPKWNVMPGWFWEKATVCHESFRGWRYFAIEEYRKTMESKLNLENE